LQGQRQSNDNRQKLRHIVLLFKKLSRPNFSISVELAFTSQPRYAPVLSLVEASGRAEFQHRVLHRHSLRDHNSLLVNLLRLLLHVVRFASLSLEPYTITKDVGFF
jgi:hypothetical protein